MLNLRDFKGGNTRNRLNYGHDKVGVYMSAFSDSVDLLSNMYIISDNNATHVSLNDLKALRMVSNELVPYPIDNTTYLTSSLSDEQIDQLTGVMFICSVKQLGDINFHVKDASYPLTTHFLNYGAADFTILFLNTNVNQFSNQSTTISQWEQNSGSSVYLYIGYPLDQPEEENSHVFSNPMKFNGSDMFFPNVEKFALTDVSFYFRTFKGGPNFKVDPGFFNVDGSVTTAYTTTGFYSKPVGEADSTKTINTSRDTKYSGFTGANSVDQLFSWSTPFIGQTFQITSRGTRNGEFYVQYFVHQGSLSDVPTTVTPTTPGVQTTTKSSGALQILISFVVSVFLIGF